MAVANPYSSNIRHHEDMSGQEMSELQVPQYKKMCRVIDNLICPFEDLLSVLSMMLCKGYGFVKNLQLVLVLLTK